MLSGTTRSLLPRASAAAARRTTSLVAARSYATHSYGSGYDATIPNIDIRKDSRVICSGFTGKTVRLADLLAGVVAGRSRDGLYQASDGIKLASTRTLLTVVLL